MKETRI